MAETAEVASTETGGIELAAVLSLVRQTAGGVVDADAPLMEAGVDSLGAVELRTQLQKLVGGSSQLPSTLIFDFPTARSLVQFLSPSKPSTSHLWALSGE